MMKETDKYTDKILDEITGKFPGEINADSAWNKLQGRIRENNLQTKTINIRERRRFFYRIAAAVLILTGVGSVLIYLNKSGELSRTIAVTSGDDQRNVEVSLPDGSRAWLNRKSQLSYDPDMGKSERYVRLRGEAFFDIKPDASKPFVIDAGKATIKVLGTSFNVITDNSNDEVEVFVQTGKVMLSGSDAEESIVIEPGYIGTSGSGSFIRMVNENRNYLSWKTDTLVYDGQTLDIVFSDLKKVFNINISADDPAISNMSLSTTFFSLPHDTIIQLICNTFTLSYTKDGSVYHLSK